MEAAFNNFHPSTNVLEPFLTMYPTLSLVLLLAILGFLYAAPVLVAFVLNPKVTTTVLVSTVATILIVVMYYLLQKGTHDFTSILLPSFLTCLFIWTVTVHWLAYHARYYFRLKFGDNKPCVE
jgi:hypothetical protein